MNLWAIDSQAVKAAPEAGMAAPEAGMAAPEAGMAAPETPANPLTWRVYFPIDS
jgi:hypothetical protein